MEEFNLDSFFNSLISFMANAFPYMQDEELDRKKHSKRNPLHLMDAIFNSIAPLHSLNSIIFDIGSGTLEQTHPYYHILEDSEVIHKRGRGTKSSKGSQDTISKASARDYGIVRWNGKTFSQEYKKNVRGSRSKVSKATDKRFIGAFVDDKGIVRYTIKNANADYYVNIHYKYFEKMFNNGILDMLAEQFGLKRMRTIDSGLSEEYALQLNEESGVDDTGNILNILSSFAEE